MELREVKGRDIARERKIFRNGNIFSVPARTQILPYKVNISNRTCTCEDFIVTGKNCKHIYAVEARPTPERQEPLPRLDFPKPLRPTYPQNWKAYNAAQTREKDHLIALLGSLCEGIQQPVQKMGRPRMPLGDMVLSMTMKVYGTQSGRRTASDLRDYASKSLIDSAPHHNTVFKYFENPELTPVLLKLIEESAKPLKSVESDFAIDATGLGTRFYSRWFDEKWGSYGKRMERKEGVKLNIMTGVKTNVVVGVLVTDKNIHDINMFGELFEKTVKEYDVKEVSADKGYLSVNSLEMAQRHGVNIYIPFKSNSKKQKSEVWNSAFHFFQYKRPEFLAHYHKRSNVETTMAMIKAKFGGYVRSRSPVAQENEALCKVLCHNLCCLISAFYELGVEAEFWKKAEVA